MYCFQLSLGNPFIILWVLRLPAFLTPPSPPTKKIGVNFASLAEGRKPTLCKAGWGASHSLFPTQEGT